MEAELIAEDILVHEQQNFVMDKYDLDFNDNYTYNM